MLQRSRFLPLLALVLAPALSAPAPAAPACPGTVDAVQSDDLPDLGRSVDGSIRWLRSTQNPADGSYGGGVEGTAWVLHAMGTSHRRYMRSDGPFVAKAIDHLLARQDASGAVFDEGASAKEQVEQSTLAAAALAGHIDADVAPALGRLSVWLAGSGVEAPAVDGIDLPEDDAAARALVLDILALRGPDGSYDGERGKIVETAMAVDALNRLKVRFAPPKAPAAARAAALPAYEPAGPEAVDAAVLRGARFLVGASQDGLWGAPGRPDGGITAMVVGALQEVPEPRPKDIQAAIDGGVAWLLTLQGDDGSFSQGGRMKNYVTSAVLMTLAGSDAHAAQRERGRAFLKTIQADEGEGYSEGDMYYGGIGYGSDERPDLSNLQMALDALVATGSSANDPEIQRALKFLERCQNRSESNDVELTVKGIVIKSGDDGGGTYMPGNSKAGNVTLADGTEVPRSYGSMTYALLKGLVFAGLQRDDPRVEAAWKWLSANYTLDVNPGFDGAKDPRAPYQGLFYYFDTMARALDVYGADAIVTPDGTEHDWRAELAGRLVSLQSKADGSWKNENAPRWWEGNPVLATAYAVQALGKARR